MVNFKNMFDKSKDVIVKSAKSIYKYRKELTSIFKHVEWKDLSNGIIIINEEMINEEIKPIIMDGMDKHIKDFNITIEDEVINLELTGKYLLFPFKFLCELTIEKFEFNKVCHKIEIGYKLKNNKNSKLVEGASSIIIMGAIKIFLIALASNISFGRISNTVIQNAVSSKEGIIAEKDKIIVNLDKIPQFLEISQKKILDIELLSLINLTLVSCKDHNMTFKINIDKPF